jgi:hypothetical protein
MKSDMTRLGFSGGIQPKPAPLKARHAAAGLVTIESWITQAEQSGGGWVQLTFHHVCGDCNV